MYMTRIFFYLFVYLTVSGFVLSLEKNRGINPSINSSITFSNKDSSHEEIHSKNDVLPSSPKHMVTNSIAVSPSTPFPLAKTAIPPVKSIRINTNKTHTINVASIPKNDSQKVHTIVLNTEGGGVDILPPIYKELTNSGSVENITTHDYLGNNQNKVSKQSLSTSKLAYDVSSVNSTLTNVEESSEKPKTKRIHGRPGVVYEPEATTPSFPSSTKSVIPKKPLFTMITGDIESKESESFIESPTTGRDYVLPIVLIILALPIVGYIIKLIYKRGTEFTERQQYHRMYLIDGMYNSR